MTSLSEMKEHLEKLLEEEVEKPIFNSEQELVNDTRIALLRELLEKL